MLFVCRTAVVGGLGSQVCESFRCVLELGTGLLHVCRS